MATDTFFGNMTIDDLPSTGTQKTLHMIFIVDNSGSMRNENRMDAVNQAFREMVPKLQEIQRDVQDSFTIMISIMAFNEDPEWVATPTEINYYIHSDIPASEYVTYFSRAFEELNSRLSRSQFMSQKGKFAQPYIMLMTDGAPTEGDDYEPVIQKLKTNGWFAAAQKYAVLIGKDTIDDPKACQAVSGFIDGNEEGIINAADAADIVENVSAKTIHIADQMTQHKGGNGGQETLKGGMGTAGNQIPGPFPEPPFPEATYPEPFPGPFPGPDETDTWPVLPSEEDDSSTDSASDLPDPGGIFDPTLIF